MHVYWLPWRAEFRSKSRCRYVWTRLDDIWWYDNHRPCLKIHMDSEKNCEQALITMNKRKSSCVNARGIPTTAYQVLHLLPEVGYPPPPGQVWWAGGGYPRWGIPQQGNPPARSDRGLPEVGPPPAGVPPPPARSDRGDLRWGAPQQVEPLPPRPPAGPGCCIPPPPRGVDRQTPMKTVPYRRTTYAVGNKLPWVSRWRAQKWNCSYVHYRLMWDEHIPGFQTRINDQSESWSKYWPLQGTPSQQLRLSLKLNVIIRESAWNFAGSWILRIPV